MAADQSAGVPSEAIDALVDGVEQQKRCDTDPNALSVAAERRALKQMAVNVERLRGVMAPSADGGIDIDSPVRRALLWFRLARIKSLHEQLVELERSISEAMQELPRRKEKGALGMAALGVIFLFKEAALDVKLSNDGDAARLLGVVCTRAGLQYSPERLRSALKAALHYHKTSGDLLPIELWELRGFLKSRSWRVG